MESYRAIPQGYMTVGEIAKKMGVTIRTLQYYDKMGLLSPSATSEGGRRLYTDKDLIRLHQILSLKHLGFSLQDIKNQLTALETPKEVAQALAQQAAVIRKKLDALSETLREIEALQAEVLQMQTVDFKKYADIIINLQMKNEHYWLIKHFDDEMLDHIRSRFDQESGLSFIKAFTSLQDEALKLYHSGVPADSEQTQALAKSFWEMVMEFTGGDMSLLPKLMELGHFGTVEPGRSWAEKQTQVNAYLEPALQIYFKNQNIHPFEGAPE